MRLAPRERKPAAGKNRRSPSRCSSGYAPLGRCEVQDQGCGALRLRITTFHHGDTETRRNKKEKALAFLCDSVSPWWILLSGWHAAAFAQFNDLVEHAVRHFPLRGFGNLDYFAVRNNRNGIAVGIKADAF